MVMKVVARQSRRTVTGPGLSADSARPELCRERRSHTCRRLLGLLLGIPGLFTGAPGLVVAAPPVLLGALSLFAAPAAAQVLVSNIGKATASTGFNIDFGESQRFTTGYHLAGYNLSSIQVRLWRQSGTQPLTAEDAAKVKAELWTRPVAGGVGVKVANLKVPSTVLQGIAASTTTTVELAAPASTVLRPNSEYRLFIYAVGMHKLSLEYTQDTSEDAGGVAGWSIADQAESTSHSILSGPPQLPLAHTWGVKTFFGSQSSLWMMKIRIRGSKAPITSTYSGGVWSATLTSDRDGDFDGCDPIATQDNCSTALTEDRIQLGSGPFSSVSNLYFDVRGIAVRRSIDQLSMGFTHQSSSQSVPEIFKEFAVLRIGSGSSARDFAFKDATVDAVDLRTSFNWANSGITWADNQQVAMSILVQGLTVDADPACDSTVSDSERPEWQVRLQPAPGKQRQIEYNLVNAGGTELASWQGAGSTRESGYVRELPRDNTFARFRAAYPGFAGFKFRLQDTPSLTVQCTWQFDNSGSGTPTDTTTTTTTTTQPTTPTTGGGGNTGGGSTPRDFRPSFDNASVPDQSYTEGTEITPLVLPEATGGNNPLTYTLTPSLPNGLTLNDVTRRLSGNPISPHAATLYTWTATDADGDEATLTFTMTIAVDPHRERIRELARRVLAEMARRAMSGALDTIGARFGAVGGSGLSLAGQPVSLESVASVADGVGMAVWNNQSLALGELLGESAFSLRLAASGEAGDGVNSEGPLWSVWGRGDLASFAGGREEETHYDGWLRSGWLGLDARSGRWVGGMAVSHEQGQADYGATVAAAASDRPMQGRLETSLTALYPYGRWQLTDGMELQGVVGVGWGEARHTPADDPRETGTLSMRMASLGVRKSLPDVAGLALALRADAAVTRIETGHGPEVIHNLSADSWRLRTGLEASRRFALEGEAFLEPFLEAAARQDGGDGLEGSGVELAGGLRYGAPNVAVELRGRWLAAHSEEGAEEQGVSLTARYGPGADGQGLFFALSPRWGAATGGAQALWGEDLPVLSTADAGNSGAVDAQVGYGFALPQGGVLTPFAEVGLAGADSRRLRLGTRYAAAVTGLEMAVELAGERRESGDAAAEHALQLDVDLRF